VCDDCYNFQFASPTFTRRAVLAATAALGATLVVVQRAFGLSTPRINQVLGRPTNNSIALSVLSDTTVDAYVEYGASGSSFSRRTTTARVTAGSPFVFTLGGLAPNARAFYRLRTKVPSASTYSPGSIQYFTTQRKPGSTFVFAVQGDSHPERVGKMFNSDLYYRTLNNVAADHPDFYITLGDDFSLDPMIAKKQCTKANVEAVYKAQRTWLSTVGKSAPLFLVNGNHDDGAKYLLDGTATNPAVLGGQARLKYFPLPGPTGFYSGDDQAVPFVGPPRDYYAWTWGDALFVTLDPYWHSDHPVDTAAGASGDAGAVTGTSGGGKKGTTTASAPVTSTTGAAPTTTTAADSTTTTLAGATKGSGKTANLWTVGIGDEQYAWLKRTLETSTAKYKFVFAHHVLGTGRGGVEVSTNYEWGGEDPKGSGTFATERPNWSLPIHQLMVANKVTAFFQGHDHLYCQQERDGIIYQEVANPADNTFTAFNSAAYKSGTILPNSGHLRVTVSPTQVKVDYVLSARPQDVTASRANRKVARSYVIKP